MTIKMNKHPAPNATMFRGKPRNQPTPEVRFDTKRNLWEVKSWTSKNSIPRWFIVTFAMAADFVDNGALIDDLSYEHFQEIRNGV